jgi:hypothetical protein
LLSKTNHDLLEEILRKNRARVKGLSNTKIAPNRRNHKNNTSSKNNQIKFQPVATVFKVLGWRKTKDSLGIVMNYVFKNTTHIYNELGMELSKTDMQTEKARFDLTESEANRQLGHFMFSLPNTNNSKEALLAVLNNHLPDLFSGHKYFIAIHGNTDHLHAHIVLKTKNDITRKQIRLNPSTLYKTNYELNNACISKGLDLSKAPFFEESVEKQKFPDFLRKTCPLWIDMYKKSTFSGISANNSTIVALKRLGLKEKHIRSFLHLYKEDKRKALWSINNRPDLFGIDKETLNDYNNLYNVNGFTLRKVEVYQENDSAKARN